MTRRSSRPSVRHHEATDTPAPRSPGARSLLMPYWPRGDGHRVLALPGLAAGDGSTLPLRWALQAAGYDAHRWELGRNVGPNERVLAGLRARLSSVARGERVSLVGWSLGGVYARLLARQRPDLVRQVITMGSPYQVFERAGAPLTVPATSIYTRDDGVVRWQLCIDETGPDSPNPQAGNIEVYGTHIDLGVNPMVIFAILDRLAQPADGWRHFHPPRALRPWYPSAESWSPRDRAA